jgi:hypothetical protein
MVIGACYMMLRSTYECVGGFSPLFRVWGADEQDLSARAWMAGFAVQCVTGAAVGHMWRPVFPYRVQFEDLEFNQIALIRTVFDQNTIEMLEESFEPLPVAIRNWVNESQLTEWREVVQRCRTMNDARFFHRFLPDLLESWDVRESTRGRRR